MWLVAVAALLCLPFLGIIVLMAAGPQSGSEGDF